jgi:hypothetical protein
MFIRLLGKNGRFMVFFGEISLVGPFEVELVQKDQIPP